MAHFNKRHYEAIATVMQQGWPVNMGTTERTYVARSTWHDTVSRLSIMFEADNHLFNMDRFVHACRPGSNVKAKTAHLRAAS